MMRRYEAERLQRLLLLLQRANLDRPRRTPTFMEIAGIGRRETAISKVLAFFLDTEADHGMNGLWLQSLLSAASATEQFDLSGLQISPSRCDTEVVTSNADSNLRIDIVVRTPDLVIGIENKIDASLYNDLSAYAGHIRDTAGERKPMLLTLTLHEESEATSKWSDACGKQGVMLCNVTYAALFACVKESVGEPLLSCGQEWLTYMRDFMTTIERMGAPVMDGNRELFEFFSENMPEIKMMLNRIREVSGATKHQGQRLREMLVSDPRVQEMGYPHPQVWQPTDTQMTCSTFFDVPLCKKGQRIHPEIAHMVTAIQIRAWASNAAAEATVMMRLKEVGMEVESCTQRHVIVKSLPIDTPDDQLVEELKAFLEVLLPIVKLQE